MTSQNGCCHLTRESRDVYSLGCQCGLLEHKGIDTNRQYIFFFVDNFDRFSSTVDGISKIFLEFINPFFISNRT